MTMPTVDAGRTAWRVRAAACLLTSAALSALAQAPAPTVPTVPTFPAALAAGAPGITQALREARLSMPVTGRVEGLFVREGSVVKAGQVLLHLDRTLEELEVSRRRLVLQDQSRLLELRAKEATLREQVASLAPLVQAGGVSRKQLEDESMALGTVSSERLSLEEAKQREKIELDLAQETYERRQLRSPISGVVTRLTVRLGESVAPHEPVVSVVDVSRVRFVGTVPAAESHRLKSGAQVSLVLGAAGQIRRSARLVYVSPTADASSGLVEVIAEFDNPDGSVRPGISGRLLY
jgi:RND family efflux transporter MFP subunit